MMNKISKLYKFISTHFFEKVKSFTCWKGTKSCRIPGTSRTPRLSSRTRWKGTKSIAPRNPDAPETKRIAIIVGHSAESQGAVSYKGETEYQWNSKVAKSLVELFKNEYNKELKVFRRTNEGRSELAREVAQWKPQLCIELHFNSFKTVAYGCEILVHQNSRNYQHTRLIADELTNQLSKHFGLRQRGEDGVRTITDSDRGAYNLRILLDKQIKYVMLIEPCFGNIETEESRSIIEKPEEYAAVVAKFLKTL